MRPVAGCSYGRTDRQLAIVSSHARHISTRSASVTPQVEWLSASSSRWQPVSQGRLHSAGDASPLAASSGKYCPIFSVVAPCHRGASPPSVRRRDLRRGLLGLVRLHEVGRVSHRGVSALLRRVSPKSG